MLRTSNYLLCMVSLKVASHLTFVFASAFQKDVKFVSTSLKFESSIRTLPLVEKDPILKMRGQTLHVNVDLTSPFQTN